jgi:DNA repair protein RecO (recombination protein O)
VLKLLLNALYALDQLDRPLNLVKAAFELRLMCLSGFAPNLDGCALCGKEPEEAQLHLREGLLHCRGCKLGGGISLPVNPSTLSALRYIARCEGKRLFSFRLDGDSLRELEGAAEAYLLTQMERGFHTLDFYKGLQTGSPVV